LGVGDGARHGFPTGLHPGLLIALPSVAGPGVSAGTPLWRLCHLRLPLAAGASFIVLVICPSKNLENSSTSEGF
jgi:hypothetical protein